MTAAPNYERLSEQSKFVFVGTVRRSKAANMPDVPVKNGTLVVKVDRILQAPEVLGHFAGREITVQLPGRRTATQGDKLIFFTNGWIFGSTIAVVAVGTVPASRESLTQCQVALASAPDRAIRAHAAKAELVVTGRVIEVRDAVLSGPQPISEHDPMWAEAVVEVDSVEKGKLTGQGAQASQVIVKYASSMDVKWHRAPKFEVGQQGIFLLGAGPVPPAAGRALTLAEGEFVVVDDQDFYPIGQAPRVLGLVG